MVFFNLKITKFLSTTILFGVLNTAFICSVLIPFFKESGMLPLQLSAILLAKKIVRLFSDSFCGLLFDKYGAKVVFFIGRVSKLISFLILGFCPNTFNYFFIAMLFDGFSYSAIYGKISAFIYNNLSAQKQEKLYPRAISIYYLAMNTIIMSLSFASASLLKQYGYHFLIYISIITNIFSIIILIVFIPNTKQNNLHKFVAKSFKDIFKTSITLVKEKPSFLYILLLYGLINFLSWQFGSVASLILLDMKYSASEVAIIGGVICKIVMALGCLIPIFFLKNGISLISCCKIFLSFVIFGLITSIIYDKKLMIIFMCAIIFVYTTIEASIEKMLDKVSDRTIRGTAISIAMTFCTIFTSTSIGFTGLIAQYFSYHLAFVIVMCIVLALTIIILIKLKQTTKGSDILL